MNKNLLKFLPVFVAMILVFAMHSAFGQCATSSAPSISSDSYEYFTDISASVTTGSSTIAVSGASGGYPYYFDSSATEGITTIGGATATFSMDRSSSRYTSYLTIYVDWNNDGTFETSELAGSTVTFSSTSTTYAFTVPTTGVVTGVNLPMRVFMGESSSSSTYDPPCTTGYGNAYEFYLRINCVPPAVTVSPTSPSFCAGSSGVGVTASGAGGGYTWSPATGLSATTGASVTATPTSTTTYTVVGSDTSHGCFDTMSVTVTVNPLPTASISPSSATICTSGSTTLTATTGTGYTYQWYTSSGAISGATHSTYTASPSSTTTYYLHVTSSSGCTSVSSGVTVTVTSTPVASISASGSTTFCSPGSITLSATTGTGFSYRWYSGSTLITGATGSTLSVTTSGAYTVVISAGTCFDSTTTATTVTVNPAPTATITAGGATSFCPGASIVLTATSGSGYSYQWYAGGSPISGATDVTYTASPSATTGYTVMITNTYGCSTTSGTTTITVNPVPAATITASGSTALCTGGSVTLTAPTGAGYSYQWYADGTAISGAAGSTYTASPTASSTDYTVQVTNSFGCSATSMVTTVTVAPVPSSSITYSGSTTFCAPGSITLSTGSGSGYSYQWYRGGTAIGGATTSNYNANATGNYKVTVTLGACSSTTSSAVSVTVNPAPGASVTPASATVCTGGSTTFTASAGGGFTYQWYFGGSPISGATNISYTASPSSSTSYDVEITNGSGCTSSATATITVTSPPVPVVSPAPANFCTGGTLTTTTSSGYTYQWYQGSSPISGATGSSYYATTSGNYSVVSSVGSCSGTSATDVVTIYSPPSAVITPTGSFTICSNDSEVLTAIGGSGYTYQWSNATGPITGATNITYAARTAGTYRVTVFTSAGCASVMGGSGTTAIVSVLTAPVANLTASGPLSFCNGGSVTLTSTTGTGNTYQWYTGSTATSGVAIAGATTSTYTTNITGYYYILVTGTNGCVTSSVHELITSVTPPVVASSGTDTFCQGSSTVLSVTVGTGTRGVIYQWKKNTVNIPAATNSTYTATSTGIYECYVNIPGSCAFISTQLPVSVTAAPSPAISYNGVFLSTYSGYASYQWERNGVIIPGATNDTYIPTGMGNYTVEVTERGGCSNIAPGMQVWSLGVSNVAGGQSVNFYPNPATSRLHIEAQTTVRVVINTMEGKKVMDVQDANDIDISALANGLYIIQIFDDNGNRLLVNKLCKQ